MSLQGVLTDFGLADIFQLIAQQRKTGVLAVEREGRRLEVRFREGAVLRALPAEARPDAALAALLVRSGVISEHELAEALRVQEESLDSLARVLVRLELIDPAVLADTRRLLNDETIFELFLWDDGRFSFLPCEVERGLADEPVGAEMVLLDALRMRDEWTQITLRLPRLSAPVSVCGEHEELKEKLSTLTQLTALSAGSLERVFELAEGGRTARQIIDLARLGTFAGGRVLAALVEAELVELGVAKSPSVKKAPSSGLRPPRLVTLALLLGSALLAGTLLWLGGPPPADDYPIPPGGLESAREAYELVGLRQTLEVHRWAHGGYPTSLQALAPGLRGPLAAPPSDRYSYFRSAEGAYVLRPRKP
ncbi:MAG: DUF4388 domain-containing protein [Myxococcota bacterium]